MKLTRRLAQLAWAVPASAVAQPQGGYADHMMSWGGGMFWGLLGWIFWLGLAVIVVLVIIRLTGGRSGPRDDDALETLKKRYARGEIGREEFESMRRDLDK